MKPISIEIQKKIVVVPYINTIILFVWLYNSCVLRLKFDKNIKTFWIVFSSSLPLIIIQIVVSRYLPIGGNLLIYVNAYLIPLIMGYRLIKYQESMILK